MKRRASLTLAVLAVAASVQAQTYMGAADMTVWGISSERQPWADFRMSLGANQPSQQFTFGSDAAVVEHTYFRLNLEEAADLATGLGAWASEPHNLSVHSTSSGAMGMTFTGNTGTGDPTHQPAVVVAITLWIQQKRGSVHGGTYLVLSQSQASDLAAALAAWVANPVTQSWPGEPLYSVTIP